MFATLAISSLAVFTLQSPASANQEPASGPSSLMAPQAQGRPKATGTALSPFEEIHLAGDVDLNLHGNASSATAEVDCPTHEGPGVQLNVQGDTLMITPMHEGRRTSGRCVVTVRAPGVEEILVSGASTVRGGALKDLEEVQISGAAHLDLRGLEADEFTLNIAGAGDAVLTGKVDEVELVIAGAASIDAKGLIAKEGELTINGTGSIKAHVTEEVEATANGGGTILVEGSPKESHPVSTGLGKVIVK